MNLGRDITTLVTSQQITLSGAGENVSSQWSDKDSLKINFSEIAFSLSL